MNLSDLIQKEVKSFGDEQGRIITGKEYNNQFSKEELENEVWKDISEWEGLYQASNLGRAKGLKRFVKSNHGMRVEEESLLSPWTISKKKKKSQRRLVVNLRHDNRVKHILLNRLILLTFVGPCPSDMEGCHNDGDYLNNRLKNLRWDTHRNNCQDKIRHGTIIHGEKSNFSKLKSEQVIEIRKLYATGVYTQEKLGNRYKVNRATISYIINNKSWKNQ